MKDKTDRSNVDKKRVSTLKVLAFYSIMIAFTATIVFGVFELGLARYYYSTESQISWTMFDSTIGWRLRPGDYAVKPLHSLKTHQVLINEAGLRNRPIAWNQNDTKRIIILGDSFTFASAIPQQDTFPLLLEERLNRKGNYDVVNAGVPGYGTAQELLIMRDMAEKGLVGDVYLVMLFTNDILDNRRLGEYGTLEKAPAQPEFDLDADGELRLTHYPEQEYSTNLVPPRRVRSFTLEVVRNRLSTFLQAKPKLVGLLSSLGIEPEMRRVPSLIYGWYMEGMLDSGVPLMKALIQEISREAHRNNAALLVSLIPSPLQVYPEVYDRILTQTFAGDDAIGDYIQTYLADRNRPQRVVSEICEELELFCLDLLPSLLQQNTKELYIPSDGHFSGPGHAVVAERLYEFVMQYSGFNTTASARR